MGFTNISSSSYGNQLWAKNNLTPTQRPFPSLIEDMYSWWRVTEGSSALVTREYRRGILANLTGSPVWESGPPNGGEGIRFLADGDSMDTDFQSLDISTMDAWTVTLWVKRTAAPSGTDTLLSISSSINDWMRISLVGSNVNVYTRQATLGRTSRSAQTVGGGIGLNVWSHVAIRKSGNGQIGFRVNGTGPSLLIGFPSNINCSLFPKTLLGRSVQGSAGWAKAVIGDVRTYPRSLSNREINAIFAGVAS